LIADQRKQTSDLPFPFAANKRKFAVSAFRLQQTKENCRFLLGSVFGLQALLTCQLTISQGKTKTIKKFLNDAKYWGILKFFK
jgi:hypothetical protein